MIITYILQVTLCLAFFYALYYAVLQKETLFRTNRLYLLSTLIVSLALPLIRIYILDHQQEVSIGTAPIYVGAYLENMNDVIIAPRQHAFPWLGVLTALYKGVVIFLICRILESVLSIFRMQRAGEKIFLYGQKCVLNPQVRSPFSFFNTIYLPKDHQFSDSELEEIITHEKTHVQGRHTLDVLFIELICCALWPSPMVYLYRKKLRELHELLADAEVLKNTPWENYASFLIAQKDEGLQQRLSNQLIYSQLKNRLVMMNKQRSFRSAKYKYLAIIPILLMSLVIFSFREKSIPNKDRTNSGSEIYDIYKDGLKVYTSDSVLISNQWRYIRDSCILVITEDKRYFLNHKEIKYEYLEEALTEAVKKKVERTLYIYPPKGTKVGDFDKLFDLEIKLHAQFIYIIPEMSPGRVNYQVKDTMSTTYIAAYRMTQPASDADQSKEYKPDPDIFDCIAIFPGCEDVPIRDRGMCGQENLIEYISSHLVYPEALKKAGIEGKVFIRFIVGIDGYVKNITVEKSLHPDADKAALNVFNKMNEVAGRWLPARKEGKTMEAEMTLPISFSMGLKKVEKEVEEPFTYVEEMPQFPGSMEEMFKYIYQSIKYPEEDRAKGNQGQVVVQFVVETDGTISNAKVVRGISPGLNDEALRVINSMNEMPEKWTPGRNAGKTVPVSFTLPFKFVLQPNPAKEKVQVINQISADKIEDASTDQKNEVPREIPLLIFHCPNPVSDALKVEFFSWVQNVSIFNESGQLVWSKKLDKNDHAISVDVSQWTSGQYIIQGVKGQESRTTSFVVQHE